MVLPFVILSYGDFNLHKKIFSCEIDGVHAIPIFTNIPYANLFMKEMNSHLKLLGDNRILCANVCDDNRYAYDIFVTLAALSDLKLVSIDPIPPGLNEDSITLKLLKRMKRDIPIDEFIEDIQSTLS